MKIKLHIGANKTGSSAIQHFLGQNKDVFADMGLTVPDPKLRLKGRVTGEHTFVFENFYNDDFPGVQLQERLEMLEYNGVETLLLSGESLSNPARASFFGPVFAQYETDLLFYIRRQDDLLMSSWQQWASKREPDVRSWLERAKHQIGRWRNTVLEWQEYLPRERIDLRIFDRASLKDGDVVRDALNFFAGDVDTSRFDFDVGNVNPSFANEIVPLVSGPNGVFDSVHDNRFYNLVQEFTGETFTTGMKVSLISAKYRDELMKFFEEENEQLRKEYLPDRKRLFAPVNHTKYVYPDDAEMQRRQMRFLTHMIFKIGLKVSELNEKLTEMESGSEDADARPMHVRQSGTNEIGAAKLN